MAVDPMSRMPTKRFTAVAILLVGFAAWTVPAQAQDVIGPLATKAPASIPPAPRVDADNRDAEAPAHSDSFWYGRFGYGSNLDDGSYGGVSLGIGRRIERDAFGLDVRLLSAQVKLVGTSPDLHTYGGVYTHSYAASLLTIKALYSMQPRARSSAYVGGGAGWGAVSFGHSGDIYEDWSGQGVEAEFAMGYAFSRTAASTRLFVEADFVQPFYKVTGLSRTGDAIGQRHAPRLGVAIGAGW